jgi:hypothetical protein
MARRGFRKFRRVLKSSTSSKPSRQTIPEHYSPPTALSPPGNHDRLERLRNIYNGHRAFVIGNGPSLKATDLDKLQNEITIGSNGLFLMFEQTSFRPTFYAVEDWLVAEDRATAINRLQGIIKLFPADLAHHLTRDDDTVYVDFTRQYDGFPRFSDRLDKQAYWGGTVTFFGLQIAYYLGIREIYLLGVDHDYAAKSSKDEQEHNVITSRTLDINHFDPDYFGPGYRWHDPDIERMERAYIGAKEFLDSQGCSASNATVGGKLEVFPRVDLDKVLETQPQPFVKPEFEPVIKLGGASIEHQLRLKFHPRDQALQNGANIFFVTGRSKSGTTWMASLLNSHPSLFCDTNENSAFHQDSEVKYFEDWPRLLHPQAAEFFDKRSLDLARNGLIASLCTRVDKLSAQKLGDKTPRQDIRRILKAFPKAQAVVMLRDYRDVCVSLAFHAYRANDGAWQGFFQGPELDALDNQFLIDNLQNYESHCDLETYTALSKEHSTQVKIVRFENLKTSTQETCREVLQFLGVSTAEEYVQKCLAENTFEKLSGGREAGESDDTSFFRKGVTGDWKKHFSAENVEVFKRIAGKTLIAAGYEKDNSWGV